jgi:hypothetical protein
MNQDRLRILQIIVAGLISGATVFTLIVMVINPLPKLMEWRADLLVWVFVGAAIGNTILSWFVVRWHDRQTEKGLPRGSSPAEAGLYLEERLQQRTILGCAFLEGGIFFNLVGCLVAPNLLSLLTVVALLALISFYFPTQERVEHWIARRCQAQANRTPFG